MILAAKKKGHHHIIILVVLQLLAALSLPVDCIPLRTRELINYRRSDEGPLAGKAFLSWALTDHKRNNKKEEFEERNSELQKHPVDIPILPNMYPNNSTEMEDNDNITLLPEYDEEITTSISYSFESKLAFTNKSVLDDLYSAKNSEPIEEPDSDLDTAEESKIVQVVVSSSSHTVPFHQSPYDVSSSESKNSYVYKPYPSLSPPTPKESIFDAFYNAFAQPGPISKPTVSTIPSQPSPLPLISSSQQPLLQRSLSLHDQSNTYYVKENKDKSIYSTQNKEVPEEAVEISVSSVSVDHGSSQLLLREPTADSSFQSPVVISDDSARIVNNVQPSLTDTFKANTYYIQNSAASKETNTNQQTKTFHSEVTPADQDNYQLPTAYKYVAEPEQIYGKSENIYGTPEENYSKSEEKYGKPELNYGKPEVNYGTPERRYGLPELRYDVAEDKSVARNEKHENQKTELVLLDKTLPNPVLNNSKKFGYVLEGGDYRKYRVEERTPDGFIVGEYGLLHEENGFLRGVRYTADGTINPKVIHDALLKFISL